MTNTRAVRPEERKTALRFYWLIIPVSLIAGLIITVLIRFESLPLPARIAGSVVIGGVIIVFTSKWWKLYQDLKKGEVTEVRGPLDRKIKFGGSQNSNSSNGVNKMSSKNSKSSATYILEINGERYDVKAKHYSKVEKGQIVQLNYLKKSLYILDVFPLEK